MRYILLSGHRVLMDHSHGQSGEQTRYSPENIPIIHEVREKIYEVTIIHATNMFKMHDTLPLIATQSDYSLNRFLAFPFYLLPVIITLLLQLLLLLITILLITVCYVPTMLLFMPTLMFFLNLYFPFQDFFLLLY